jgi:predicted  nucleic acid-binding Zn-ribbon protein
MPHQCLKCGRVFQEGSSELLKGCSDCGGNRFFYTKEPLGEKERVAITEKVGKDLNTAIMDLMGTNLDDVVDQSGNWVKIKPKDVRKAMKKHISESKKVFPESKDDIDIVTDDEYRKTSIEQISVESKKIDTPETIDIEKPGRYNIDIKGLLDEEPIIIQKDGSYTIHLPSIFKMIDKEKKQ